MESTLLAGKLTTALRASADDLLQRLAGETGFAEKRRTAANLRLLRDVVAEETLAAVMCDAAASADPDLALNNLERLAGAADRQELIATLKDAEARRRLLIILGASSFLTGILCRRADYFRDLFPGGEIKRRKTEAEMQAELVARIPEDAPFAELQKGLRQYKAREILRIGGRDLCELAPLPEVTGELSDLAAACLEQAYRVCDALLRAEYGAPLLAAAAGAAPEEAAFTVLGMGKFGGRELNFSSDIDLIYFYSSEKGETAGVVNPLGERRNRIHLHQYFCKLGEMLTRAIGQATEDGFVFRVDLRLRPEGNNGDMATSLRSAEVYYESWGQSWERSALLKARPVAGCIALGEELLRDLEPFIYRRYLDYAMIEDIKQMKQKIDRSLTREREGERNLKLGRGGIREIEFFIQTLQLIYAGRNPSLRERNSLRALKVLQNQGLIKAEEFVILCEAYTFLRTVEHRIQVVQEQQTHNLPVRAEELRALARRCGYADTPDFEKVLEDYRRAVEGIYRDLFYTSEAEIREEVRPEVNFLFDPAADPDLVKDILEEKGFKNVEAAFETLITLRDGPPRAHLSQRGRRHLERIAPLLLQETLDSPEPDMALLNLERFLTVLRARATFFALLAENREILRLLIALFGTSQFLSRIFIQHPEILDSLVSRSYAVAIKEEAAMAAEVGVLLDQAADYEEKLDVLRRYRNEEMLRVALNDLHGHTAQAEGTAQLSALARVCLKKAFAIAREELIPRFGLPFRRDEDTEAGFAILGMGKLGGMELNYHSDLDIIFIYEGEGETRPAAGTEPERFRPQSNPEYFARLAQRIISVLTLMTREGYVYQIDTRLRPSGNQGPLVTSLAAFERYHTQSAQLWERQALTKARVVVGPEPLARRIGELVRQIVFERPLPAGSKEEIYRLRARMESEIARESSEGFNIKTGRGGLVDVEFLSQYLQLLHGAEHPRLQASNTLKILAALRDAGLLAAADFTVLDNGYRFLRRVENRLRLVHDQSISQLSGDRAYLVRLARRLGYPERPRRPDEAFLDEYRQTTEKIRAVFDRFIAPEGTA
ncbi:MAG: bifunctional [glutamate--ammonia ligase]-adenylyl-L-tyrosine phosphorylase/[glutamate--ammonia-ligase] adenylyltransferase [Desulfuromonadales bacterium]